ncbi:MAG TPA: hypothetical protein PLK30_01365 [Blastocatellia bacterium]|nr:hypothetical protein [Blastocatellia bacterium]
MKSNQLPKTVFVALALLLTFCSPMLMKRAYSQSQTATNAPPRFAMIEYFKIEPGKGADYRKLEQEVWVPIHRERVKMGAIKSWSSWSVRLPGGVAREYDRVIITTFNKFSDVETPYPPGVFTKVFPNTTAAEIVARTGALSKLIRSEMVTLLDSTTPTGTAQMPKFAEIGFHKAEYGKGGEYVELERKYWKAVHQERVNRGILNAWNLYSVRYPGGTNREYGHITLNFFDKFEQLETQYPADVFAKALPNVKVADVVAQTNAAKKQVRIEVLNLVDQVQ